MELKDKLRQLDRLSYYRTTDPTHQVTQAAHYPVEAIIKGNLQDSPHGAYFLRENLFPLEYIHGTVQIAQYLDRPPALLGFVGKSTDFEQIDLKRTIFIDTETTGLSGGAGTYAFLVGIGFFTEEGFRVIQYFMNELHSEKALLQQVNQVVNNFELMISYNGKSYDLPLLLSRNVLYRMTSPLAGVPHLDLLFAVRRLWKHRLRDCSLTTAEQAIVESNRMGDVPGYLIPQLYFDYIRNQDARGLKAVFYHNEQDLLSLAALATKACRVFQAPFQEAVDVHDILSVGKVYDSLAAYEQSIRLYDQCLNSMADSQDQHEIHWRLAANYKRTNEWQKAAQIWHLCIKKCRFRPTPYIELAKYYEHAKKDFKAALEMVQKALGGMNLLEEMHGRTVWPDYKYDLEWRKTRLLKKRITRSV